MKNKKILFVANAESIHTVKWVDYFINQEYSVYLATFSKKNSTKCKNIYFLNKQYTQSKTGGNYHYLLSIYTLSKIIKDIKPDIINAHYSYSMGLISLLAKKLSKVDADFSVVCHGSDILDTPNRFIFDKINSYILNRTDKIFVVSSELKDKILNFGIDINKIFIGQYGLELQKNSVDKDIDILSNRAYEDNSQIDFLLEQIENLNRKDLKIVFVLPKITDEEYNHLVSKYKYIKFYKQIEYSKMIDIMSRTKIYISATKSDGTSLSLLEAMMYGCTPLVSDIISNRSWIVDGLNGYMFNTKNEFIEKINHILKLDKKDIEYILNLNFTLLEYRADYKKQMKKIENFLMEIK
ncbi:MAG: glycosyltransferase [Sulfurovaceae bacterium]|nr:glycosyltransferase [Sulfurovaceae bacterium]